MSNVKHKIFVNRENAQRAVITDGTNEFLGDVLATHHDGVNLVLMKAYAIAVLTTIDVWQTNSFGYTVIEYTDLEWAQDFALPAQSLKDDPAAILSLLHDSLHELVTTYEQF